MLKFGLCLLVWFTFSSGQQCYYPDGTAITDPDLNVSCGRANENSACCGASDECYTNGLCKGQHDGQLNWFWRYGCTNQSWEARECGHFCQKYDPSGRWLVLQCSETEFCCAYPDTVSQYVASNYTCCNNQERVFDAGKPTHLSGPSVYVDGIYPASETETTVTTKAPDPRILSTLTTAMTSVADTTSLASSTLTLSRPSGAQAAASSSAPSTPSPDQLAIGLGAGLGIPLAIALIAGLAYLIWLCTKRSKSQGTSCPPMYQAWPHHQHSYQTTDPHSPFGSETPQEIQGTQYFEMPQNSAALKPIESYPQELADVSDGRTVASSGFSTKGI